MQAMALRFNSGLMPLKASVMVRTCVSPARVVTEVSSVVAVALSMAVMGTTSTSYRAI
jgi:hypothetical protein